MKTLGFIFLFITQIFIGFGQEQRMRENNYQIGMMNQSSSLKGFSLVHMSDRVGITINYLPLFSKQHKIYSSIGVSGIVILDQVKAINVYGFTGGQSITTHLGENKRHLNFGVGIGIKTKLVNALNLVCQSGYGIINVLKHDRQSVFTSEIGVCYQF